MPANAGKEFRNRDEDFGAIDVAALMAQVTLKTPEGTVTVSGTVEALWRWPNEQKPTLVYGNLRSFDKQSAMSFRCPVAAAPGLVEEHVILRGTLTLRKATKHRGFDFQLIGNRIGEWTPSEPPAVLLPTVGRTKPKLSLERFLLKETGRSLVLIGTETAIDDAKKTLARGSAQSLDVRVCTTEFDNLQTVIIETAQKYDGLCLMRGGGPKDSFAVWNDDRLIAALIDCGKPFYMALGHSNYLNLADKYADESFGTPSDFGSAYVDAWNARKKWEDLQNRFDISNRKNQKLEAESARMKQGESERNMALLETAIVKLPATIEKQTGQFINTAVRTSILDNFSRPIEVAVKGSIINLNQATDNARSAMTKMAKVSRLHRWTWLLSFFLLGALAGSFGYHLIAQSKVDNIQNQLEIIRQQTALTAAPESKPIDGKLAKGHRGH